MRSSEQPTRTMPGMWQRVLSVTDQMGANFFFASGDELLPNPERVWLGAVVSGSSQLSRNDLHVLEGAVEWRKEEENGVLRDYFLIREADIDGIVATLRRSFERG
jgi:hypothetical protein